VLAEAGTTLVSALVLTEVDHLARARFGSGARSALIDYIVFQARRGRPLDLHSKYRGSSERARRLASGSSATDRVDGPRRRWRKNARYP